MQPNGLERANERTRTADLLITNELLYQLSYIGFSVRTAKLRISGPSAKYHTSEKRVKGNATHAEPLAPFALWLNLPLLV